jgi:hypothetical protein
MAASGPPNQSPDLATLVRHYVHYDNLTNTYSKQATAARKLKDDFEDKVIQLLRTQHMDNAIIQVSGATLQLSSQKSTPSFTMPRLKQYLHQYYAQKGTGVDETDQLIRYLNLQKQNDTQEVACLKKTLLPQAIPRPPTGQLL